MWIFKIKSLAFEAAPVVDQTVDISYREGGTSGYFLYAGQITVNGAGEIISEPNPFEIELDESWESVEIQAVNLCNEIQFTKTFNQP